MEPDTSTSASQGMGSRLRLRHLRLASSPPVAAAAFRLAGQCARSFEAAACFCDCDS